MTTRRVARWLLADSLPSLTCKQDSSFMRELDLPKRDYASLDRLWPSPACTVAMMHTPGICQSPHVLGTIAASGTGYRSLRI